MQHTRYVCIINHTTFIHNWNVSLNLLFQVQLSSEALGGSVDECDALLKKHEAFERLIISQEEKVCNLSCYISEEWGKYFRCR